MTRIPRGVVDDRGLAVVHDRAGTLVALDAATGVVAWRGGRGLRPCAIVAGSVVSVEIDDPPALTVHVLAGDDGRELWRAQAVDLPVWARPTLDDTPEFELDATVAGEAVVLRWAARSSYRGGAMPGPAVLAEHTHNAGGAIRVDLAKRRADVVEVPAGQAPTPDPRAHEAHGVRVELGVDAAAVVLRGVDADAGGTRWEVPLDEAVRRRPPPLRQ